MPYRSKAQVGFMHVHHPTIARKWDRKYGIQNNLPRKVRRRR